MRTPTLWFVSCAVGFAQTGAGVNFYSIEKEIALGRSLVQELERQTPPVDDPEAQQYVEQLGKRLVAALPADTPAFPYSFKVVAEANAVIEPIALPGGFVFVPVNLIRATTTEAELAGILAHVIAHIAARHGTRQETRGQIANYATLPLVFMGGGWSAYAERQASQVLVPAGFLNFARANELEADRMAVEATAAAGYDPEALLTFVDRTHPPDTPARPFSPLPAHTVRIDNLRAAIARLSAPR